ncbi:hypothetical protein LJK88_45075 [Paenibacillus sp. P26]|nr:hypothetical protein LJK88_45075 [Paenibacillus sp. P26]UUZ92174.1 hypothetical protein LJK87_43290 [Paenibacillus sp. P25]
MAEQDNKAIEEGTGLPPGEAEEGVWDGETAEPVAKGHPEIVLLKQEFTRLEHMVRTLQRRVDKLEQDRQELAELAVAYESRSEALPAHEPKQAPAPKLASRADKHGRKKSLAARLFNKP